MKKLFLHLFLSALLLGSIEIQAQTETVDQQKSKRELRREARNTEREVQRQLVMQMLTDTSFVLELSTIYGRRGDSYQLNPLSNFFAIDGELASIQYAFNNIPRFAGIGGSMSTGDLIVYEVIEPKGKKPLLVRGRIAPHSRAGLVLFEMHVQDSGNTRMNMTTASGDRINLEGQLVPTNESVVFKTTPLFRRMDKPKTRREGERLD